MMCSRCHMPIDTGSDVSIVALGRVYTTFCTCFSSD